MRIVHVLYSFDTGGLEKGIATVVRHGSHDNEHVILCMHRSGLSARLLPEGTRIVELHKPPGNSVLFLGKLARSIRRLRPDIVHTRNWSGMDGVIAARLAGAPAIVHGEHGWGMEDPDGSDPRRVRVRRFLSRWVREYTCVSKTMINWLRDDIRVSKPIHQVYNGVDVERFRPRDDRATIRASLGIDAAAPVIGIVGRLDPIKNHLGLVEAFREIRTAHPDAVLAIVGNGPERRRIETAVADLGSAVRMLGDRDDVPDVLAAFDVFVLPSFNEGISNTILEAMASGLPVIACRVGGNPELIRDGHDGTLVDPDRPDRIAQAALAYLDDENLARVHAANARREVCARFSIEAMVEGYEAVWSRVGQAQVTR